MLKQCQKPWARRHRGSPADARRKGRQRPVSSSEGTAAIVPHSAASAEGASAPRAPQARCGSWRTAVRGKCSL